MKLQHYKPTLVNFRVSTGTLAPFDHSCVLAGKTRTQVLTELMTEYASKAASSLNEKTIEREAAAKKLKNAVENAGSSKRGDQPEPSRSDDHKRLKRSFSSFWWNPSIPTGALK